MNIIIIIIIIIIIMNVYRTSDIFTLVAFVIKDLIDPINLSETLHNPHSESNPDLIGSNNGVCANVAINTVNNCGHDKQTH